MSFLGSISSMIAQPTFQAVAAGLLSGAVIGSTVVASGILPLEPERAEPQFVALLACPGAGPELARVPAGQELLITGRSADGAWLEVYIGEPGVERAWAPAPALRAESAISALPIAACDLPIGPPTLGPATLGPPTQVVQTSPPTPTVTATVAPTLPPGVTASPPPPATATPRVTASPTPKPTPTKTPTVTATPTPTPFVTPSPTPLITPPPDLTPPSITNVNIAGAYTNGDGNYYIYAPAAAGCPYHSATISASVTDAGGSGLAGFTVTLRWKDPFGTQYNQQMSYSLATFRYTKTISAVNGWPENTWIQYWITASDNAGNQAMTSSPPDNAHWLFTGQCLV